MTIVCSSDHISIGSVPGMPPIFLFSRQLCVCPHTHMNFIRREILPAFRVSGYRHTFVRKQKETFLPPVTASDFQPALVWSHTLRREAAEARHCLLALPRVLIVKPCFSAGEILSGCERRGRKAPSFFRSWEDICLQEFGSFWEGEKFCFQDYFYEV